MNVLSLFDGISCGQLALQRAEIKVDNYFASEIDKDAIKVTQYNFPLTKQLGDVTKLNIDELSNIDLLIGGSPCQDISNLGSGEGLEGKKSSLFFYFLNARKKLNPKYFLLENVVGNKKSIKAISELLGVEPILINSNLVSAQNRARYYWTNIPILTQPTNKNVNLIDILDHDPNQTAILSKARLRWLLSEKGQQTVQKKYAAIDPIKANCLTARSDGSWNSNYVTRNGKLTKLTCEEYEKLQTIPITYTSMCTSSQRYKMIGNAWTVDVISHIFKGLCINSNKHN